jgi:hypothetical protein
MSWERRFGAWLLAFMATMGAVIALHWWQESQGEDAATIWSCHTMGNRDCGPGVPWHGIIINTRER